MSRRSRSRRHPPRSRRVSLYVIELTTCAGRSVGSAPFEHPWRDPSLPCVYVGSTGKTIAERLADHQSSGWEHGHSTHPSHVVHRFGVRRLRMDLVRRYAAKDAGYSREEAAELERALAEALVRAGYGVAQG